MHKPIDIHEDDLMWKFYCKWFAIQGREIKEPKNLCPYFWTALLGFGLWLGREVRLSRLWLLSLGAIALGIATHLLAYKTGSILVVMIDGILLTPCFIATATAIVVSAYRFSHFMNARFPRALYVLVGGAIVFMIGLGIQKGLVWPELERFWWHVSRFFWVVVIGCVLIQIITFILVRIPEERLEKCGRTIQTIATYLRAKKDKVCPPVNPPKKN